MYSNSKGTQPQGSQVLGIGGSGGVLGTDVWITALTNIYAEVIWSRASDSATSENQSANLSWLESTI